MKIGFFTDTYTPQINGVVHSIRLFKEALEQRGHEVYVFAPDPDHHEDGEVTVRFPSIPFMFQKEMRLALPLSMEALRVLDEVDFDIVHSHDPFSIGLFGLNVARRHRVPYVHTYHTLYPEYVHYIWETRLTRKLAEVLSREFCDACDSIIAPSSKVEGYLYDWGVRRRIEVISTGVDIDRYANPDPARVVALKERLAIPANDKVLMFMGRLGREKNVELLLHALWHSRLPSVRLLVCGDGPYRGELEALSRELGIESQVTFAGYMQGPDSVAAYHLADAFAFASTTETQGLVIAEAMAAGLPIVAVRDPATCDFVTHERNGLITPHRAESIASAFDQLLADDAKLRQYSQNASEAVEAFSIARQAERLENHYMATIAAYTPRRKIPSLSALRGVLKMPGKRREDSAAYSPHLEKRS